MEVGEKAARKSFTVHEDLVRKSSPFFEAALSRDWTEAKERTVKLPEHSARAFELYMNWLYSSQSLVKVSWDLSHKVMEESWSDLLESYLLGEYLQDTNFKDTIIDSMLEWTKDCDFDSCHVPATFAAKIYEKTTFGSPLRSLLLDFSVYGIFFTWIDDLQEIDKQAECPRLFMWDVVMRISDIARMNGKMLAPYKQHKNTCHYHSHGEGPCYNVGDVAL